MKSNLSRKELEALRKKVDRDLAVIDRASKRVRHNLHELEESFPGLKPLGGGGSDK